MKFALFILASWTENTAAHQRRIYHEALEQVRYAEALGFDAVWIAEHHSSRYGFQIVIEQFWLLRNYAILHKHL